VTNDYQWFNADGHWSYEPVKSSKRIASGTIDVGADAPAKFSGRVNWGAHRLELKTLDGEQTSVAFDVGWSGTAGADTPDNVVVTLDKTNYTAGEEAKLRSASPQPSPVRRQSHWSATRSSASSMSISCPAIMLCPLRSAPTGTPALTPSR
jgi:uncharacterized protein YfaS (alpha-2-macroglobulin family)